MRQGTQLELEPADRFLTAIIRGVGFAVTIPLVPVLFVTSRRSPQTGPRVQVPDCVLPIRHRPLLLPSPANNNPFIFC